MEKKCLIITSTMLSLKFRYIPQPLEVQKKWLGSTPVNQNFKVLFAQPFMPGA